MDLLPGLGCSVVVALVLLGESVTEGAAEEFVSQAFDLWGASVLFCPPYVLTST